MIARHVGQYGYVCPGDGPEHPAHPTRDLTLDHVVALIDGGAPFDPANTRVLCRSRNSANGARLLNARRADRGSPHAGSVLVEVRAYQSCARGRVSPTIPVAGRGSTQGARVRPRWPTGRDARAWPTTRWKQEGPGLAPGARGWTPGGPSHHSWGSHPQRWAIQSRNVASLTSPLAMPRITWSVASGGRVACRPWSGIRRRAPDTAGRSVARLARGCDLRALSPADPDCPGSETLLTSGRGRASQPSN